MTILQGSSNELEEMIWKPGMTTRETPVDIQEVKRSDESTLNSYL